jgi:A/G-specific adenine glycosylase
MARRLLAWWDLSRRDLPWRARPGEKPDPYVVWLSEVLLQQTTIATATPYFNRFRMRWPTVDDLAAAPVAEIMRAFAGLGYYARARNMHACARAVVAGGGVFPDDEAGLRKLPGVGAYTAGAVAAIAFNRVAAPVDGNIARVLCRLHGFAQPIAQSRAALADAMAGVVPAERPGDFVQATMDFGAMICTPRSPSCERCPLRPDCAAHASGEPELYPRRAAKRARPLRKGAAFFAMTTARRVLVRDRAPEGLLGGLTELPGAGWSIDFDDEGAEQFAPLAADWRRIPGFVEQVFTHFALRLTVFSATLDREKAALGCYWIGENELAGAALSSVMVKAIAHARRHETGQSLLVGKGESPRVPSKRPRASSTKRSSKTRS